MTQPIAPIFRITLIAAATLILSGCTSWAEPPAHLMFNQEVKVKFKSSRAATQECSDIHKSIKGKKNGNIKACAFRTAALAEPVIVIPNPCEFDDIYATLLCHELGHINQMALGELVDHDGWGVPALRTASRKTKVNNLPVQKSTELIVTASTPPELRGLKEHTDAVSQ